VGESGCGKSMTALALLRLLPDAASISSGKIMIDGENFLAMDQRAVEDMRGEKIAMIFQEPLTALNPVLRIGEQIAESVRQHRKCSRKEADQRAVEVLRMVQMPDPERRTTQFPHELSGGMRQRAMIAIAIACTPRLLIADEPTTALDVTVQAQILDLLRRLIRDHGMALLLITHDLGVVADMCELTNVMYGGRVVESAPTRELFRAPTHPYTRALLQSIPTLQAGRKTRLATIEGQPPVLRTTPVGCTFARRCPRTLERCRTDTPALDPVAHDHVCACWNP
jgi:peptide/nickel transport system ATP-binding protein